MIIVKPGPYTETTEVNGIIFADELFEDLTKALPLNVPFCITSRENGVLIIYRLDAKLYPKFVQEEA